MDAIVLFTLPLKENGETVLVVAQKNNGEIVWSEAAEGLFAPFDGIDEADTYPLALLPPEQREEIREIKGTMSQDVYESLFDGWRETEI